MKNFFTWAAIIIGGYFLWKWYTNQQATPLPYQVGTRDVNNAGTLSTYPRNTATYRPNPGPTMISGVTYSNGVSGGMGGVYAGGGLVNRPSNLAGIVHAVGPARGLWGYAQ